MQKTAATILSLSRGGAWGGVWWGEPGEGLWGCHPTILDMESFFMAYAIQLA